MSVDLYWLPLGAGGRSVRSNGKAYEAWCACREHRSRCDLYHGAPPVWGRDDLETGEMWNSNSIVAWLLVTGGIDPDLAHLPARGRAPGWRAGLVHARRTLQRCQWPATSRTR